MPGNKVPNRTRIQTIRAVQERIRQILLDDWDPIGIKDVCEAQDEYDSYVGQISRLVVDRRGSYVIAQKLAEIETDAMGLGASNPIRLEPLAQKLAALADQLSS